MKANGEANEIFVLKFGLLRNLNRNSLLRGLTLSLAIIANMASQLGNDLCFISIIEIPMNKIAVSSPCSLSLGVTTPKGEGRLSFSCLTIYTETIHYTILLIDTLTLLVTTKLIL